MWASSRPSPPPLNGRAHSASFDAPPEGAWFHDFEDAPGDTTVEPGPIALTDGTLDAYRRDERSGP